MTPRLHARRYAVGVTHPDGSVTRQVVVGGTSTDAAIAAMEQHGLGCRVRVECVPPALAELLHDMDNRLVIEED